MARVHRPTPSVFGGHRAELTGSSVTHTYILRLYFEAPSSAMVKMMIFLKRRPELSQPDFARWWLDRHRPLAEQLPGLRRHCFNLLPDGSPFDAAVEQWFDSEDDADAAYVGEIGRAVAADSVAHVSERLRVCVDSHDYRLDSELDTGRRTDSSK